MPQPFEYELGAVAATQIVDADIIVRGQPRLAFDGPLKLGMERFFDGVLELSGTENAEALRVAPYCAHLGKRERFSAPPSAVCATIAQRAARLGKQRNQLWWDLTLAIVIRRYYFDARWTHTAIWTGVL